MTEKETDYRLYFILGGAMNQKERNLARRLQAEW
jgi:hypothetical protein